MTESGDEGRSGDCKTPRVRTWVPAVERIPDLIAKLTSLVPPSSAGESLTARPREAPRRLMLDAVARGR